MVADPLVHDPDTSWFVEEYGQGIMITKLKRLGAVFTDHPERNDDLEFLSRAYIETDVSD